MAFAILCAKAACKNQEWLDWAGGWLSGAERSEDSAIAASAAIDAEPWEPARNSARYAARAAAKSATRAVSNNVAKNAAEAANAATDAARILMPDSFNLIALAVEVVTKY